MAASALKWQDALFHELIGQLRVLAVEAKHDEPRDRRLWRRFSCDRTQTTRNGHASSVKNTASTVVTSTNADDIRAKPAPRADVC